MFNERKCSTSDRREGDKAYGVTAINDQNKFKKEVGTNLQPFITYGQQCMAVPEDEERRDVFVSAKTFSLGGSSISSSPVSSRSSNKESSKSTTRESSRSRKTKC